MVIKKLLLHDSDLKRITDLFLENYKITYQLISETSATLAFEEYYFRNGSMQLNMIVLLKTEAGIRIDAIGGGGSGGMFTFSWGSEKEFANNLTSHLIDWAEKKDLVVEEIETLKI